MQVYIAAEALAVASAGQDGVRIVDVVFLHIDKIMLGADGTGFNTAKVIANFGFLNCLQGDHRRSEVLATRVIVVDTTATKAIDDRQAQRRHLLIAHQDINVSLNVLIDDLVFDLAVRVDGWKSLARPIPPVFFVILGPSSSPCRGDQARLSSGISSQVWPFRSRPLAFFERLTPSAPNRPIV